VTFEEAALLPRSEKITLVTMLAEKRVKFFDSYSGFIYSKDADYYVHQVKQFGVELEIVNSIGLLSPGTYFYSYTEKKIYVWLIGDGDPSADDVSLVYKFHFSNAPVILPSDLTSGNEVEWLPYIETIGSIGQSLDDENTGIVLESSSSVNLINQGFFDEIFDTLLFENKAVSFYYWFPVTPVTEARKIFEGVVESKSFAPDRVTFNVKDFIFRLRDNLNLGSFSESDGSVLDTYLGTPKRRIYGRVSKCQCVGLDTVKDGYALTGLISGSALSKQVNGSGTFFLDELSSGDEITFIQFGEEVNFTVDYIQSNTVMFLSEDIDANFSNLSVTVSPAVPWRKKNRRWHLAGHKLRSSQAEILTVVNARQFVVDDNSEFFADDVITITTPSGDITTQVTRVSGDQIILEQNIFPVPIAGDIIRKEPVLGAYFGNTRMILNRDFTVTNTTEAIIEIDELAEFNLAREKITTNTPTQPSITFTFTNGQKIISTASNVDLKTIIKPRDWIRSITQTNDVWFEVMKVEERAVIIRENYSQATNTAVARIKEVNIISDDSLITVDCYGIEYQNKWVRTASNAVRHMVKFDAGFLNVNESTFEQADVDCKYTLSIVVPESLGSKDVLIRDEVTKINESVFGSLYGNTVQEICYSIVNTRRPATIQPIKDDDVLSWSSESSNEIVNAVTAIYGHFTDTVTGEAAANYYTFNNEFVNKYTKIKRQAERNIYLYDASNAETIAQRIAFYGSLSQLKVNIKSKAIFFNYSVNDRLYIDLDRLYKRYGSGSRLKIGIVSSVKKGNYDSEIVLNDLGNIFNRCPSIAPSATMSFISASDDDKVKFGFILDNDTLVPGSSEDDLGSCLIG
jgi:hypothetical protein